MTIRLPLRFRLLELLCELPSATVPELMARLQREYGGERQLRASVLLGHLLSLRAAGLLEDRGGSLDSDGSLLLVFAATEAGRARLKYLPRRRS
jgi:DNA-binding PadR family transcriptional regulator